MDDLFNGPGQRRRAMNLGGTAQASQREVFEQARASRQARLEERRRQEAATQIQALWRGNLGRKRLYPELRRRVGEDIAGLDAMKCLALLPADDEVLGQWSHAMCAQEDPFSLSRSPQQRSWLALMRRIEVRLLHGIAKGPMSPSSVYHARILNLLFTKLGDPGVTRNLFSHLLQNDYYKLLNESLAKVGVNGKKSPILPPLASLITVPFATFAGDEEIYSTCLRQCLRYIMTLPLLPNRLPIASLTEFSSRLPLSSIDMVEDFVLDLAASLNPSEKAHLLANLVTFMPPRYTALQTSSLKTYLRFLSLLLSGVAPNALEPLSSSQNITIDSSWVQDDEDVLMEVKPSAPSQTISLDNKTRTRLDTLSQPGHLQSLLTASSKHKSSKSDLYSFLLLVWNVWPLRKDKIISSILASSGDGFIRELYRLHVRSSPLGKSDDVKSLKDPAVAHHWPSFLCLTDMYTQLLLTMGDDEFFASSTPVPAPASSSQRMQSNPLTIGEIISFSRQALNIALALYWGIGSNDKDKTLTSYCVPGINVTFEDVRYQATKLVQAVHARDSRKPFTPPNHWLFSTQLDMRTFVSAAVIEEQEMMDPIEQQIPSRSRRDNSHLTPRLAVLNNVPFAIPFNVRVEMFRQFVRMDMAKHDRAEFSFHSRTRAVIRRDHVSEDGFNKLGAVDLKGRVQITFVDHFGEEEAGIDGGGLFKEFFTSLCREVFDTNRGLWSSTPNNELYPSPHSFAKEPHSLEWYRFIGRILGKAMYEGILVDVAFAGFFLAKWLGKSSFMDDLASLDNELYKGLIFLKHYTGNCEDLSLTFSVNEEELGVTRIVDLIPNGRDAVVTKENRLQYIVLMCHYRLTKQIRQQSAAFFEGLSDLIDPNWLRMFNQQELQILIGGVNSAIDLEDLRANTNYGGAYSDEHPTIQTFWKVVSTFSQEQRQSLLRFATSCSRPPLLGFKELYPKFSLAPSGDDENRLPTASTCVNFLKLPMYRNERTLKQKLLQAITSGAGFNLS